MTALLAASAEEEHRNAIGLVLILGAIVIGSLLGSGGEEVSDVSTDPAVATWRTAMLGQSTSAQLRETQAALAASQADLTSALADLEIAERERDGARAAAEEFWRQRDKARAERDALAKELSAAHHENRILTAENESALRRLNEVTP
jgi:chromosome segregation ATPase